MPKQNAAPLKLVNPYFSFILHLNCILSSNIWNTLYTIWDWIFPCIYPWITFKLKNLRACYYKLVPSPVETILLTKIASSNLLGESVCGHGQAKINDLEDLGNKDNFVKFHFNRYLATYINTEFYLKLQKRYWRQ